MGRCTLSITYIEYECDWCGGMFKRSKGRNGGVPHRFCTKCQKEGVSIKYSKIQKEFVLKLYIRGHSQLELVSLFGISSGTISRWVKKAGISRLPSQANKGKYGSKSHSWKGGRTAQRLTEYSSEEYKNWRLAIFKRDNFTCVSCGQAGGMIHAHHILPYGEYKILRTNIQNGVTLCESCHCRIHGKKKMGRWRA